MLQQDEIETIQRAAQVASQLAEISAAAGPLLEELTTLLDRIGRPCLAVVPLVAPPDLGGELVDRVEQFSDTGA